MYFFYYVPVGLDAEVRRRPLVTWYLCIVCAIVFILYRYMQAGSWWDFTLLTFQPSAPSLATGVTHAFLHGGWLHLVGNLVYLALFGRALESRMGPARFYAVFVAATVAGAYLHTALTALYAPEYLAYGVIGASGATSGVLGAYLVRLHFSRIRVAYWIFMPLQGVNRAGRAYVPVVIAIFFWFALQAVRTVMQYGTGGARVAYGEHVGGFAAGVALALVFGSLGEARAERHLVKARRHFGGAEWFAAQAEYIDYLARRPGDLQALVELARSQICVGNAIGARATYAEAIRASMEKGARDRAEELFGEASRHLPHFALDEERHIDIACGMERTLKYRSALAAYEQYLWRYPLSKDAPFVLLRMAGIHERRFDQPEAAFACYRRLTDEYASDRWSEYALAEIARLESAGPQAGAEGNK